MSWPLRALFGPALWAISFSLIYAAHGLGCARGWTSRSAPIGDLHHFTLIIMWLMAVVAAGIILWRSPTTDSTADRIVRTGGRIGLLAVVLTLFPVLGLTSCAD